MSRIIKTKKTTLKGTLSTTALSMTVQKFVDQKDVELVTADFDGDFVVVLEQGTNIEMILCTAITQNGADATAILTIDSAGRHLNPQSPWTGGATGIQFTAGATVIVTNDPYTMSRLGNLDYAQTWALLQTFTVAPVASADAVASNELVRKSQLDLAVLGTLSSAPLVVPAVAGETIAIDKVVYLKASDSEWYLADADTANNVENVILGVTRGAGTDGVAITDGVTLLGEHIANSAIFTADTPYFASDTAGEFSSSAGTYEVSLGHATSTTKILFVPRYNQQITEGQQDALEGTVNAPSASNKYVTNDDTGETGASTLVRTKSDGLIHKDVLPTTVNRTATRGETIDGATTPSPALILNDLFQLIRGESDLNFGKVTTDQEKALQIIPRTGITSTTLKAFVKKNNSPTDNYLIEIQGDNSGEPDGTPITNGSSNDKVGSSLTTSYVEETFTFASAFTLVADTTYWVVIKRDGTLNDTDHYLIDGMTNTNTYGSFLGSTNNSGSWSSTHVPYFEITPATGTSESLWESDANHLQPFMREFYGFVIDDGNAGVDTEIALSGVVSGFTGLTLFEEYYVQDSIGTIGVAQGTYDVPVGTAISATEIFIDRGKALGMRYIGSDTGNPTIAVPSGARFALVHAVADTSCGSGNSASAVQQAQFLLTKVGMTTATHKFREGMDIGATGSGEITATWSGDVITITENSNCSVSTSTVYFYK